MHKVETKINSDLNATNHEKQIPEVLGYSSDSVELSVTVDSGLVVNEIYSADIFVCEEETLIFNTEFSKSTTHQACVCAYGEGGGAGHSQARG